MKILVIDHGLNLELARLLARVGHQVAYHCDTSENLNLFESTQVGKGFEKEGLTQIDNPYSTLSKVDAVCLFDTHSGDEVDFLRGLGYKVWGAGAEAEKLELDRWFAAKAQRDAGLPLPGAKKVVGVSNLLKELQEPSSKDHFVKCSGFRSIETFLHQDWAATQEQFIAPLLCEYGTDPTLEFILEAKIEPAQECGADNIIIGGGLAFQSHGYEAKDTSFIGAVTKDHLPASLEKVNNAMLPYLKKATTFFSTEVRTTPSGKGYPIDMTVRAAHPPMAGLMEVITNLSTVITSACFGEVRECSVATKYYAVLVGTSGWAADHRLEVSFPEALRNQVKLTKAWKKGDKYFLLPSSSFHVQAVGLGNTPEEATKAASYVAEQVKGKDLSFDFASFDKLLNETIPTGKKYGINF